MPFVPLRRSFAALTASLLAGCMVAGVDYTAPDAIVPDSWHQNLTADLSSTSSSLENWWRKFDDPALNRLVQEAMASNRDLAVAFERVNEARAARGIARSQLFPTLDGTGGANRSRASENNLLFAFPGATKPQNNFALGLEAGWELDLFGGVRRSIESADASVEATAELYRDTLVSLLAEVSLNYIQLRTLEERLEVARRNIKNQESSLELTRARLDAGLAPELDATQAEANLATTRAAVPFLQNQRAQALNRLATLIGRYPQAAATFVPSGGGIPSTPSSAGIGLPADLVRARPDIRAAERQLAAQTAQVGVAAADLYPRFTLGGTFALQSLNSGNLLDAGARSYSFGPNFRWALFNAGRIRSQIDIQESRTRQAYFNYENAVLRGVEEVENALASLRYERDRLAELDRAVAAARRTEELVNTNYTEGLVDFQNVLDAQRTVFANEDEAAISRGQIAASYVALFRALGGGTPMRLSVDPNGKS